MHISVQIKKKSPFYEILEVTLLCVKKRNNPFAGYCLCLGDFGGDDCSIDKTQPPLVFSLAGGSVCDRRLADCCSSVVFGRNFINSRELSCHFQRMQVSLVCSVADKYIWGTWSCRRRTESSVLIGAKSCTILYINRLQTVCKQLSQ